MAEKPNRTIGELNRDERKEAAESISDNAKLCDEINYGIKKEFEGKAKAELMNNTIVIFYGDDIIAEYGDKELIPHDRIDVCASIGKIISRYKEREQEKEEKEHNKENGIKDEINNEEDKEKKSKTKEEIERLLEQETGNEYKLQLKIAYNEGNKDLVDTILHFENFTGDIYTAKNMKTGENTIIGIGTDGKPREIDQMRFRRLKTGAEEVKDDRNDGKSVSIGHESSYMIAIDDDKALEFGKDGNIYQISNYRVPGSSSRQLVQTEPVLGREKTTKEMDEMKKDPESMHLIDEKLNKMVNDGLINNKESEKIKENLLKNNKTPEEDLKDLEDLEEKLRAEKEKDESRFPEGPWDRAEHGRPRG